MAAKYGLRSLNRIPSRPIELFLHSHYLVKTLRPQQRLQCYNRHFEYLVGALKPFALSEMFVAGLVVFERVVDGKKYQISIAMPQMHRNQGELAISLLGDGAELYAIGFTLVPGAVFSLASDVVILISRMQGASGSFEGVHQAAKAFRDVTPQALLFAALQGCARALRLERILGASARLQLSYSTTEAAHFQRCYDEFYELVGAGLSGGIYVFDCAATGSIFDNMPLKHRARTKAKRKLKAEISAAAAEALGAQLSTEFLSGPTTRARAPFKRAPRFPLWRKVREGGGRLLDALRISRSRSSCNGAVDRRGEVAPLPVLQISAAYLPTMIGEKRGAKIVTTGKAGCLVCGPFPYAYLVAGTYEAAFEIECLGEFPEFTIDVSTDRGKTTLARKHVSEPTDAALRWELAENCDEIEFRMFVPESASLAVKGVTVLQYAPPATNGYAATAL